MKNGALTMQRNFYADETRHDMHGQGKLCVDIFPSDVKASNPSTMTPRKSMSMVFKSGANHKCHRSVLLWNLR